MPVCQGYLCQYPCSEPGLILTVFVVAFPAENFPLWGAICAHIVEGVMALAGVAAWVQRRNLGQPGAK